MRRVWEQIAPIDWDADREHSRKWILALLDAETPGPSITGALKGVINSWKAAKEASENLDFLGAAKDILQGGKELLSRYLPIQAPTQRYPTLEPPPLPTPSP